MIFTIDKYRGHEYKHFLTGNEKMRNFSSQIRDLIKLVNNDKYLKLPNGQEIKLHFDWQHMNSSQIMCINFFLSYWNHPKDLKSIFDNILLNSGKKIIGLPTKIKFEDQESANDGTNVDLVIDLDNGSKIFIEVKYTERGFGKISSKVKKRNPNYYFNKRITIHKDIIVDQSNYEKYYQFIRNIYLGRNGNYTLFLYPFENNFIENEYNKCSNKEIIENINDFEFGRLYWEDLLKILPNEDFRLKYFGIEDDWK